MRSGRNSAVHRARRIAALLVLASIWASLSPAAAKEFETQESYRGLTLAAVAERPGETFDIVPLGHADAMARIKNAIDILYNKSPLSARAI